MDYVLYLFLLVWISLIWVMICNYLTLRDKMKIIHRVFARDNWYELSEHIDAISYDRHLWLRMSFRNWRKEYPKEIQDLLGV